jgi:alpha-beta hydrolase superfamily lysophospholipase
MEPTAYGLKIVPFPCADGKAPCLLVEPAANTAPGKRGAILRRQVADQGVVLPPYGVMRGIVVLLHGRAGRKEDLLPVAERFVATGFRCLIPDLPGHGESPLPYATFGASEFERALPNRVLGDAQREFGLAEEPAALWGISMGGAIAVRAASESPDLWKALIVLNVFDALDEVVAARADGYLGPLGALVTRTVDHLGAAKTGTRLSAIRPRAWAERVTIPSLVVHGEKDELVPVERGRALFAALNTKEKRWLPVAGGSHHSVLTTPAPVYAEMTRWLLRGLGQGEENGSTVSSGSRLPAHRPNMSTDAAQGGHAHAVDWLVPNGSRGGSRSIGVSAT